MEFQDFIDKIGSRYTITEGDLVESVTGEFVVSETFAINTIYLNRLNKTCNLITNKDSYIGRPYKLRVSDCINLVTSWLDNNLNTNYNKVYDNTSRKDLLKYLNEGMDGWFEINGFTKVTTDSIKIHDCIIYNWGGHAVSSHIGVYVGDNKILHHIPNKLSCIDTIDNNKILGAYRNG